MKNIIVKELILLTVLFSLSSPSAIAEDNFVIESANRAAGTLVVNIENECPCTGDKILCAIAVSYSVSIIDIKKNVDLWGFEFHKVIVNNTCRFLLILGQQIPIPSEILQRPAEELGIRLDSAYSSQIIPFFGQLATKSGGDGPKGGSCQITGDTVFCDDGTSANVKGALGPAGPSGNKGEPGSPGAPGKKGSDCWIHNDIIYCSDGRSANLRGPKGEKGAPGDKGDKGDKGLPSAEGANCRMNGTVITCEDGSSEDLFGPEGEIGDIGVTGSKGPPGPKGPKCIINGTIISCNDGKTYDVRGPAGPRGDTGPPGDHGDNGIPGYNCEVNAGQIQCEDGAAFPVIGPQGPKGDIGPPGPKCTILGSVLSCEDGTTADLRGTIGPEGDRGQTGPKGVRGASCKIDGKIITCGTNVIDMSCTCPTEAAVCEKLDRHDGESEPLNYQGNEYVRHPTYAGYPIESRVIGGLFLGHRPGTWQILHEIREAKLTPLMIYASVTTRDEVTFLANITPGLQVRILNNTIQARHDEGELNGLAVYLRMEYVPYE